MCPTALRRSIGSLASVDDVPSGVLSVGEDSLPEGVIGFTTSIGTTRLELLRSKRIRLFN